MALSVIIIILLLFFLLFSKGDHDGAIKQYIKTIGHLEPSYVIRKVLYNVLCALHGLFLAVFKNHPVRN